MPLLKCFYFLLIQVSCRQNPNKGLVWFGEGGGRNRGRQGEGGAADRKNGFFGPSLMTTGIKIPWGTCQRMEKYLKGFVLAFYLLMSSPAAILSLQEVHPKTQVIECLTQVGHKSSGANKE